MDIAFGTGSHHFKYFEELTQLRTVYIFQVERILGLLKGALSDLESGLLPNQDSLTEGFDSVLDQTRHLCRSGHTDPAAMMARVVLEDALRKIAQQERVDSTQKAAKINDELRDCNKYGQPKWRQIRAWLDIGNAAAHGRFNEYDAEDINAMIEGIEHFLLVQGIQIRQIGE